MKRSLLALALGVFVVGGAAVLAPIFLSEIVPPTEGRFARLVARPVVDHGPIQNAALDEIRVGFGLQQAQVAHSQTLLVGDIHVEGVRWRGRENGLAEASRRVYGPFFGGWDTGHMVKPDPDFYNGGGRSSQISEANFDSRFRRWIEVPLSRQPTARMVGEDGLSEVVPNWVKEYVSALDIGERLDGAIGSTSRNHRGNGGPSSGGQGQEQQAALHKISEVLPPNVVGLNRNKIDLILCSIGHAPLFQQVLLGYAAGLFVGAFLLGGAWVAAFGSSRRRYGIGAVLAGVLLWAGAHWGGWALSQHLPYGSGEKNCAGYASDSRSV